MRKNVRFRPGGFRAEEQTLADDFKRRDWITTPIRKPTLGTDGLPLFDPKVKHEADHEAAQRQLWGTPCKS